jgi:uncharacterized membrane protein YphA (DoxX/SURF4 family)
MLSAFPYFLSFSQLSPLLIRLTLGGILIFHAYRVLKNSATAPRKKIVACIEALSGILLVIGLWTQVAALIVIVDLVVRLFEKIQKRAFLTDGVNYYVILLVLAVSLLVTGAGMLAFDLPL